MRKLILVVHTSLDGFVAGPNGELNWFPAGEENLVFVCKLTETADAALFGKISYQLLDAYWPSAKDLPNASNGQVLCSNWYNQAQKIVISRTAANTKLRNTIFIRENVGEEITKLKKQRGKDILIFGSPSVAQSILSLIDQVWIFINPVLFAQGIPLSLNNKERIKLNHLTTHPFANGEIAIHYEVIRS